MYLGTSSTLSIMNHHKLNLLSINARSLAKNYENLIEIINKLHEPPIITIGEIWQPTDSLLNINNYQDPILKIRDKKKGGGIGIWVKNNFNISKINDLSNLNLKLIEAVSVDIKAYHRTTTIIAIYKPPNKNSKQYLSEFNKLFNHFSNYKNTVIFTGDTNIDTLRTDNLITKEYLELIQAYSLEQLVTLPTRITKKSATCIDHIITNRPEFIKQNVLFNKVADHQTLVTSCFIRSNYKVEKDDKKTNNNSTNKILNLEKTVKSIENINWENTNKLIQNSNAEEGILILTETINKHIIYDNQKHTSKKYVLRNQWMTKELLDMKFNRNALRKKFISKQTPANESAYKKAEKSYKKQIADTKRNYYHKKVLEANGDSKKIWQVIGDILNRKKKNNNKEIHLFDENTQTITTDPHRVAEIFNLFYLKCAPNLAAQIPKTKITAEMLLKNTKKPENSFSFRTMCTEEIIEILTKIKPKRSSGADSIPNIVIRAIKCNIAESLTHIINNSFENSTFPQSLKTSKIKPLEKTGNLHYATNFRPINLLSTFSKIIEKAALFQFVPFLTENNIISEHQFGFQKDNSTIHPLILTIDYIEKHLNQGFYVALIGIDYKKAFDMVDCKNILPAKLKHYNINQSVIDWYTSFFTKRKQFVNVNNVNSEVIDLEDISVTQGSCSGPINFNILINDLVDNTNFYSILFADDTNLLYAHKNIFELEKLVNIELEKLNLFTQANRLSLNLDKTVFTIFKPKNKKSHPNMKLFLGNNPVNNKRYEIKEVNEMKFLGVIIDNKLKFNSQYEKVIKKINSGIAALSYVRYLVPTKTKIQIYNGLINPHYSYANLIWTRNLTLKQKTHLITLQKRSLRIIYQTHRLSHTADLFIHSGITRFDFQLNRSALDLIHRTQMNKVPKSIKKLLNLQEITNNRTNDKSKFKIPPHHKKGDLLYEILDCWNKADSNIKEQKAGIFSLKKDLKKYFETKYVICNNENCASCKVTKKNP